MSKKDKMGIELPEPALLLTVDLPMVKGGVVKKAPFYSADQMLRALTEAQEARAEVARLTRALNDWV